MNLKTYICGAGKFRRSAIPRGAVARVSQALGVPRATALKLICGLSISPELDRRADEFAARGAEFAAQKPGMKTTCDARDVLLLRGAGNTYRDIGDALGISHETARKIVRASCVVRTQLKGLRDVKKK